MSQGKFDRTKKGETIGPSYIGFGWDIVYGFDYWLHLLRVRVEVW